MKCVEVRATGCAHENTKSNEVSNDLVNDIVVKGIEVKDVEIVTWDNIDIESFDR